MPDLHDKFDALPDATPEQLHASFDALPDHGGSGILDSLGQTAGDVGHFLVDSGKSLGQDAIDTGRGVEQGLTFGGGSIVNGALGGTADELADLYQNGSKGGIKDEILNWVKHYRQNQQESAKSFKDSQERSPWLYGAGEIGGALAPALLSGGIAAAPAVLAKQGLKKTLGKAALKGAGVGAVSGALSSEGTLDDEKGREKMLADAIGGGVAGGILAPGIEGAASVGGKGLKKFGGYLANKAGDLAEDSPLLRQMQKSYKEGRVAGTEISAGTESRGMQGAQQAADVDRFTDQFIGAQNKLGKNIGNAVDTASQNGVTVDLRQNAGQVISTLEDAISKNAIVDAPAAKALVQKLKVAEAKPLSPNDIRALLPELSDIAKSTEDKSLQKIISGIQSQANNDLNTSIPNLQGLKDQYSGFLKGGPETIIGKGMDNTNNSWLSDMSDPEGKLATNIKGLLKSSQAPGSGSTESLNTINQVVKNLQDMESKNPGIMAKLGIDPSKLGKDMQTSADDFAISRSVLGEDPKTNPARSLWSILGGANTGRGQLLHKANLAGRQIKNVSESKVADFSRQLYNMPSDQLTSVANKLKTMGLDRLGGALERGLAEKNESLKNAALFTIMQNPKARLLISGDDVK
jgi:hypothetical protein